MQNDSFIDQVDLPGAGFNFQDVTDIFIEAANDMEPGEFIFMDDFTLYDAMSAFEIGEPRLDSGIVSGDQNRPKFNPQTPLLPEELCWILDRCFSYDMEWHAGNLLSHTVFTLLYVHRLAETEFDLVSSPSRKNDQSRPMELIYIVLRAYVMGLLKCCDLTWRELSKGGVQDAEDWQSEKCDVSLLEGVSTDYILSKLEEASNWLLNTSKLPVLWRNALCARILLRKTILQLMQMEVFSDQAQFQDLINVAHGHLTITRTHPSPEPGPDSPVHLVFDSTFARHLNTLVPLRIISAPTLEDTWKRIDALLDGWQELSLLSQATDISTWDIVGNLRVWLPDSLPPTPYIRSLMQSTFHDGLLVLNKYSFAWLVDRFFFETLGVSYDHIVKMVKRYLPDTDAFARAEPFLHKLITPRIRGHFLNSPRRRRHLAKSLLDWHALYDVFFEVANWLKETDLPKDDIVMQLPDVVLVWRLSAIREVILSGFQLELFALEERPVAYWYGTQVLDTHLSCLDNLLRVVPKDSMAYREMEFQFQLLTALQAMLTAVFVSSMSLITFSWSHLRPTFYRRYKWAFRPAYDNIDTPVVGHPELHGLMQACSEALQDEQFSPSGAVEMAEMILLALLESGSAGGWAGQWEKDRARHIRSLVCACERLHDLPPSVSHLEYFNVERLKWDSGVHPWFPSVSA